MSNYIYPKHVLRDKIKLELNSCFVITPFHKRFDLVYVKMNEKLKEIKFECTRSDYLFNDGKASGPILSTVSERIISSHFIIADLTGNNVNVFYELGIAHSCREPQEVILISQNRNEVPFDIRNLNVIEYNIDNIGELTDQIIKIISGTKNLFEGRSLLLERYKKVFSNDSDLSQVTEFFDERPNYYPLLLLTFDAQYRQGLLVNEQEDRTIELISDLQNLLKHKDFQKFRNLLNIFIDVMVFIAKDSRHILSMLQNALNKRHFDEFALADDNLMNDLLVELAIALFQVDRFKNDSFNFIRYYLSMPKIAGIDLRRGKIESFIFQQRNDAKLHEWLISCLTDTSQHLREEAADLLGGMEIAISAEHMIKVIRTEMNPYVARSIFSALGKIGSCNGGGAILEWLETNVGMLDANHKFILTHAQEALKRIDSKCQMGYLGQLDIFLSNRGIIVDSTAW